MTLAIALALATGAMPQNPPLDLASCTIVSQGGATEAEKHAARELAGHLAEITGHPVALKSQPKEIPASAIIIGPGPIAQKLFPEVSLSALEGEEFVWRRKGGRVLLAGGRPRGTLYAVYRLLHDRAGVRWWTPWATTVPKQPRLLLSGPLSRQAKPAFESRDPFWFHAFDRNWAARNCTNGFRADLDASRGGKIVYKGFVHTFFDMLPPAKHFDAHPEWYSEIGGRRVKDGQLCTTNPELRREIVRIVRQWLRESPEASIVSVSQNDWYRPCACPSCKAIDDAEGSHAGTMIALVNHVAEQIEDEFPTVAVDTLAYQYTRRAPRTVRPRKNVIVRLCSIECNFAQPLEHPSNQAFAQDIRDWSKLTDRLYVWDYTTDFPNYVMPFPNWFVLGPNVRFFANHGVKGLFEQGAYQSHGSEMAELRAWVLAQLLWNPDQDDGKLIDEFLTGYYGAAAARPIRAYMALVAGAAKDHYTTIWTPPTAPFFSYEVLSRAEAYWQEALRATQDDPVLHWRVRLGHLPVRNVWLTRWNSLVRAAARAGDPWPLPASRREAADQWMAVATGPGPKGWAPITHMNEGATTPQQWASAFATDPAPPVPLPNRTSPRWLPEEAKGAAEIVDGQDDRFNLYAEGDMSELLADPAASDGIAAWMPATHHEWAVQLRMKGLPHSLLEGSWRILVVYRTTGPDGQAISAGVYDDESRQATISAQGSASGSYRVLDLGPQRMTAHRYVWVAPIERANGTLWIDRVLFVRAR